MKKKSTSVLLIIVILGVIVIGATAYGVIQVNAQNQSTNVLVERLEQYGVPVIHVITLKRLPYLVEISLQSTSEDTHLAPDDNWNMQLARKEATLAYRYGPRIDSYLLKVYNAGGEIISSEQNFVHPGDLSQKNTFSGTSKVSSEETKKIVLDQLKLSELSIMSFDVINDELSTSGGTHLQIILSSPDLEAANRSIALFLTSLEKMLDTINDNHGTKIILCHVRLVNNGVVLLDYVKDTETGFVQLSGGNGLTDAVVSPPKFDTSDPYPSPLPPDNPLFPIDATSPYP